MPFPRPHIAQVVAVLAALTFAACSDSTGPGGTVRELGVVVTSTDVSLTLFDVDDPTITQTVGLAADGSPVFLAVRGSLAAVPLGVVPAVAVVDLREAAVARTVALPTGSGATGAAFLNDSIVLVANPNLNSVTPVNVLAGTARDEVTVGRYPQAVVVSNGRAYVLNGELANFTPDGPSTITVLDTETLEVLDTIELSGENAAAAFFGADGRLYVVDSGSFGSANGALSIVDPATATEVDFVQGFGDFPGSVAVGGDGLVYVGAFGVGTLVWDPSLDAFTRGPDDPVTPGTVASTSGIGVDSEGRVYALTPDCQSPATAHRLSDAFVSVVAIPVGICPFGIGFTEFGNER